MASKLSKAAATRRRGKRRSADGEAADLKSHTPTQPVPQSRIGALEAVWLMAVVTLPVAVNPFASSAYESEKAFLLRCWALAAALIMLVQFVVGFLKGKASALRGAMGWLLAVLVSAAVSASLALVPGDAWLGGPTRGGGVLTLAATAVMFAAVATGCRERAQFGRLLLALLLAGVLPTAVGLLQVGGVKILTPSGGFPQNRPWATFGNSIALGSFLIAVIPVTAWQTLVARGWRRLWPVLLLAAQFFLLWRTASRGPLAGLLAAGALAVVLLARRRGWRNAALAAIAGIIVLFAVSLGGIQLVARSEMVRHFTRTGMFTRYNTVDVRVQLYKAMTRSMCDTTPLANGQGQQDRLAGWRPWLGYGPECLTEPLMRHVAARFEVAEGFDHLPDATHSDLMDVLGGTGLIGLVARLGFLVSLGALALRALGLQTTARSRRLAFALFVLANLVTVTALILLWGPFAWALGILAGSFVGLLLAIAVFLSGERRCRDDVSTVEGRVADFALVAAPALLGLWVEAQFGVGLVTSKLYLMLFGGLLAALTQRSAEVETAGATTTDLQPLDAVGTREPVQGLSGLLGLAAFLVLVSSLLHNSAGATSALTLFWNAVTSLRLDLLALAALIGTVWTVPRGVRRRVLAGLILLAALYLLWHSETLTQLRVGSLRSLEEVGGWFDRRVRAACLRLLPLAFLPLLLVRRPWRELARLAGATIVALFIAAALFWTPLRQNIMLDGIWTVARLGEPRAAVEMFDRTIGRKPQAIHFSWLASQARQIAARATLQEIRAGQPSGDGNWDDALRLARAAVAARPYHTAFQAELGGVLSDAARAATDPQQRLRLAREAEAAYMAAVRLAPSITVHRRRLAGLRYQLLDDRAGAEAVLEELLTLDPQNPVSLSMFAQWEAEKGRAARDPEERAAHYRAALLFGERCLRSPTIRVNRVNVAPIRKLLPELRKWFREAGLNVPALAQEAAAPVRYTEPRLPQAADHEVLTLLALRGGLALGLALLLTPLMRWLARRSGFVDNPAARKLHAEPTPLLGGVAIALAVTCAWTLLPQPDGERELLNSALAVSLLLGGVGLWDDRRPLHWGVKLLAQTLAALALYLLGVRVQLAWLPVWVNLALTLAWLVGITNAVNFLDNMNGLSAGLSALIALCVALFGILNEGWCVAALALAVAGACLGFLRYNHHWYATIFMGDAGSLFLGSLLACLALLLRFPANHNWVTWLCPVLLLAVPVFDMLHVCLARLRRGQNPLATPGKDHTSHLLARMGLARHGAVLMIHLAVLVCGIVAGIVAYASALWAYALAGVVFAFAVFLLLYFELRFGAGGTEAGLESTPRSDLDTHQNHSPEVCTN